MLRIDSHQHFWKFDPVRDSWITDNMAVIQHDFLPPDLFLLLQQNNIEGCVAVQSHQSEADNDFLLELAAENPFIKGVVGWVDLQADDIEERLRFYKHYDKMKGFRHVLQGEPDEQFMLGEKFKRGISFLGKYDYTYDILIYPKHLKYAKQLVAEFPEQKFIIDHIAKPLIKDRHTDGWKQDIEALAKYQNVSCKISGMVTEADWDSWDKQDFKPYLDTVFNAFGSSRVLYGSDWPVCLLAGGYGRMIEIVKDYTSELSLQEQELFWGLNATNFYNLNKEIHIDGFKTKG